MQEASLLRLVPLELLLCPFGVWRECVFLSHWENGRVGKRGKCSEAKRLMRAAPRAR
jgi:hypothetical protein